MKDFNSHIGDFAKDIRLNLTSVLADNPTNGLTYEQVLGVALAAAYVSGESTVILFTESMAEQALTQQAFSSIHSAVCIMAMNNVYYRAIQSLSDEEYVKMPAGLRMNVIANPGIEHLDFELYSLAVSAINGCGYCLTAHEKTVRQKGLSKQGVQTAIKIAAVIQAASQAIKLSKHH